MQARQNYYNALFALVSGLASFKTTSQRLEHWTDVSPAEQPALYQVQKNQSAKIVTFTPTIWTLYADLVLYANTGGDMKTPPMTILNPIVDAIVNALLPNPATNGEQTLGGIVHRCRIEGDIVTDEGVLGSQAVVLIPVTMYLPQ